MIVDVPAEIGPTRWFECLADGCNSGDNCEIALRVERIQLGLIRLLISRRRRTKERVGLIFNRDELIAGTGDGGVEGREFGNFHPVLRGDLSIHSRRFAGFRAPQRLDLLALP